MTQANTLCPTCGTPKLHGTLEIIQQAKRVGRQEVIAEVERIMQCIVDGESAFTIRAVAREWLRANGSHR